MGRQPPPLIVPVPFPPELLPDPDPPPVCEPPVCDPLPVLGAVGVGDPLPDPVLRDVPVVEPVPLLDGAVMVGRLGTLGVDTGGLE